MTNILILLKFPADSMLIIREKYIRMTAKIQGVRSKQKIWSKVRYDGYKMHGIEIIANEKGLYVNM
jgi:hypothetical protein